MAGRGQARKRGCSLMRRGPVRIPTCVCLPIATLSVVCLCSLQIAVLSVVCLCPLQIAMLSVVCLWPLQIAMLSSVYHKPPETFVSRQRLAVTKAEELEVSAGYVSVFMLCFCQGKNNRAGTLRACSVERTCFRSELLAMACHSPQPIPSSCTSWQTNEVPYQ